MADTAKRLGGPDDIPTTETTLYTVPSSTTAVLRNVRIANTTTSAATIRLSIGAYAAGTALMTDVSIPANSVYMEDGFLAVLTAAETLRATGGTNNALTVTVSGVEIT